MQAGGCSPTQQYSVPSTLLPNNGASATPGDPFLDSPALPLMTNKSHLIPLLLTPPLHGLPLAEQALAVWSREALCPWAAKQRAADRSRIPLLCHSIPPLVPPAPTSVRHGKT